MECGLGRLKVHYEVFGEGRPILMLHGSPVEHNQMVYEMEPIFNSRPGWKRIYPDMPGHGRTPPVNWITNSEGMLKTVEDFIDKMIPSQRFRHLFRRLHRTRIGTRPRVANRRLVSEFPGDNPRTVKEVPSASSDNSQGQCCQGSGDKGEDWRV